MTDVTEILQAADAGDPRATGELLPLVYRELRNLAAARLAHEAPGHSLQATALVHEAFLRLVGQQPGDSTWANRRHFFSAAATAMQRVLVEHARRKGAKKRGGDYRRLQLEQADFQSVEDLSAVLDLDEALARFAEQDPQKAELVRLRYFCGLPLMEAGQLVGLTSRRQVDEAWAFARAWLARALQGMRNEESP